MRTDEGAGQRPIESGFGWQLVFIDSLVPERQPGFSEIEPEAKAARLGAQKAEA